MKDNKKTFIGFIGSSPSSSSSSSSSSSGGGGGGGGGAAANNNSLNITSCSVKAAVIIRKQQQNSSTPYHHNQDLHRIHRLKQYFLYSKLKSLLPAAAGASSSSSPPFTQQLGIMSTDHEGSGASATEMELLEPHECLVDDQRDYSDDEIIINIPPSCNSTTTTTVIDHHHHEKKVDDDDDDDGDGAGWGNWGNVEYEREDEEDEESKASRPFKPSIKILRMEDSIQISSIVQKDISLTSTLFGVLEEEKLDILFENQYRTETKVAHTIQVRVKPGYDVDALEKKLRTWAGYST
ncbi:hypothetical protein BVC80_1835g355 [Macleaya cordata]|uniref:Uncharacterized protein n=1 Tax=Macleaya cordata TaxID=56857 RepID=A0A200R5G3_MACCD|nr:hypothetical protein BVC80_1835g355 [Macleaya cordata]